MCNVQQRLDSVEVSNHVELRPRATSIDHQLSSSNSDASLWLLMICVSATSMLINAFSKSIPTRAASSCLPSSLYMVRKPTNKMVATPALIVLEFTEHLTDTIYSALLYNRDEDHEYWEDEDLPQPLECVADHERPSLRLLTSL